MKRVQDAESKILVPMIREYTEKMGKKFDWHGYLELCAGTGRVVNSRIMDSFAFKTFHDAFPNLKGLAKWMVDNE